MTSYSPGISVVPQLALKAAEKYIHICFKAATKEKPSGPRKIYFSRGTFQGDIRQMKTPGDVIINANHLRRIFNLIVSPHQLDQIVCIHYTSRLQEIFKSVTDSLRREATRSGATEAYFGGIDYFETTIFSKALHSTGLKTIAIFHENYTIPLVLRQTENIIRSYPEIPAFTQVHAIGLPAMKILSSLYDDVRQHAFPRFKYSTECKPFKRDIGFIPFSTITYFAPVAASITYSLLADLAKEHGIKICVKHKNNTEKKTFIKSHGSSKYFLHTTNPSASEICATTRLMVCYNSLVYYEALAHGHLIAIPDIAEAKLGEIYTQHGHAESQSDAGIRTFSSLSDLERILAEAKRLTPADRLHWTDARRRILEQSFYIN